MTNEEEKILDEEDITLEEAAEEAEELQEETQDEGHAIEIPIERREDADLEEILERQVLRGGLRGAADPNMIQKHIDNFLAMLCGETPVDSNVRTSAEYWLKRLATGEGAGSTKKIYYHPITMWKSTTFPKYNLAFIIIDNDPTPYTLDTFMAKIASFERVAPVSGGYKYDSNSESINLAYCYKSGNNHVIYGQSLATGEPSSDDKTLEQHLGTPQGFYDGVNAIN